MPHPPLLLRRSSSSPNSPYALRLAVGAHAAVGALPVEVVPVHAALVGGDADLQGHPRLSLAQQRQDVADEGGVPEMVGAELQLEPVLRQLTLGRRHHPGVADEGVDGLSLATQRLAERGDRLQR